MPTLAEKITALQEDLVQEKDTLLQATESLNECPDEESLLAEVEERTGTVEQKTATLEALKKAENAMRERAKPVEDSPAIVHRTSEKDASELWVKNAVVQFKAFCERKSPDQVLSEVYPKNKALEAIQTINKTAVPVATTFTTGWAKELVQTDIRGFIDLLTTTSVAAALASRTLMLNFDGYDSVTIPRRAARTATNDLGGAFVGEAGAIPLGQLSLSSTQLMRYKMGVISTFSKELAERSTPSIEAIIRQGILADMSIRLDSVFLGAAAQVNGVQPAGILSGVTVAAGTAGGGVAAVTGDIKSMVGALVSANLGTRPILIVNTQDALSIGLLQTALGDFVFRTELNGGRLLGVEVVRSLNVTKGTAILVDGAAIATAFDMAMFDVSDVATVVEANADLTAPTMASDAAGAIGSTANQVLRNGGIDVTDSQATAPVASVGHTSRSLWQTHSVGIKAVMPVSWGIIQPGGVVGRNSLSW